MPKNRKYFLNKTTVLISARTEEGLPFPPNHLVNYILWGILAQAQTLYPVRICHFIFMANHFHMLLVVNDPEDIPEFVRYIKSESSHAINKLCGRRRKTIWCSGYDSPTLLTAEDVQRYIEYIYLNPAKANLVESIEQYPGVSSWEMFKTDRHSKAYKKIPRDLILPLTTPTLTVREQKEYVELYQQKVSKVCKLTLEPFAWMECFTEMDEESAHAIKKELTERIKLEESILSKERKNKKKVVIGTTALRRQSLLKEHIPKKFGKKMICICSDIQLRIQFIEHFKYLSYKAYETFRKWKAGDFSLSIPSGMFAPGRMYHSSSFNLII